MHEKTVHLYTFFPLPSSIPTVPRCGLGKLSHKACLATTRSVLRVSSVPSLFADHGCIFSSADDQEQKEPRQSATKEYKDCSLDAELF